MKNAVIFIMILTSLLGQAQSKEDNKFQVGVSYSFANNDGLFNNPFIGNISYKVVKWNNVDLNVGLNTFYYVTKESQFFSNKWGFNPTLNTTYNFKNTKFSSYLSAGYYMDSFHSESKTIGVIQIPKRDVNTRGITLSPGLKYFVHPSVFIDANLMLLFAKKHDDGYRTTSGNNTFFNFGFGVAF